MDNSSSLSTRLLPHSLAILSMHIGIHFELITRQGASVGKTCAMIELLLGLSSSINVYDRLILGMLELHWVLRKERKSNLG